LDGKILAYKGRAFFVQIQIIKVKELHAIKKLFSNSTQLHNVNYNVFVLILMFF